MIDSEAKWFLLRRARSRWSRSQVRLGSLGNVQLDRRLIGDVRNRLGTDGVFAEQFFQRVLRGSLFRFLFVRSPSGRKDSAGHDRADVEHF